MRGQSQDAGVILQAGTATSGVNLGGIGTGGVELWPDGRFHHWNMLNCRPWATYEAGGRRHSIPPVHSYVGDTDFFLRVHRPGERPVYRWLFTDNGDMVAMGHFYRQHKYFFIKACPAIEYRAEYPFVYLRYLDPDMPVAVELRAWTPFVPRDVKNSSLPGAFLDFTVTNKSRKPVEVSLLWQQQNFSGYAAERVRQRHSKLLAGKAHMVRMEGSLDEPDHDSSGCMTVWALAGRGQKVTSVASNPYMPNLIWPVHLSGGLDGPLMPPRLQREELNETPLERHPNKGWLCVQQRLAAGRSAEVNMGMAWFYPNHVSIYGTTVGHVYENWFSDSADAAKYLITNRPKLLERSRLLPDTLMASTLPEKLKLSLLDQLNTLTKSTHFIKSGRFGLQEGHGCCAFNTMDVDHYSSFTLSTLFPQLREKVLDMHTELAHPVNGKIHHGLEGSVEVFEAGGEQGYNRWDCCCQYVLQLYRDAKWSGSRALLERCWPAAKRAMDLIIGMDFYDVGLPYIEGGITYDHWRMKGVVAYMAGLYLAALRAMEDAALLLGEPESAARYRALFERGLASFEDVLWNGEQYLLYYGRRPKGEQTAYERKGEEGHLEPQRPPACCARPEACVEIRDTGVMTDLMNGNTMSAVLGLGEFLDPARVKMQLRLILDRNVQPENMAVINGSYPDGHFLDEFPFMQWQTPWSGTEYFLAMQLYGAGMAREADRVIDMVHDRHVREGMRFDHCECNNHYARPLSIWGAYAARMGLDVDGLRERIAIRPAGKEYAGLLMTSTATCRLEFSQSADATRAEVTVLDGTLAVRTLVLPCSVAPEKVRAVRNGKPLAASVSGKRGEAVIALTRPLKLKRGQTLDVTVH